MPFWRHIRALFNRLTERLFDRSFRKIYLCLIIPNYCLKTHFLWSCMFICRFLPDRDANDFCQVEKITPKVMALLLCRILTGSVFNPIHPFFLPWLNNPCSSFLLWTIFTVRLVLSLMRWITLWHKLILYLYELCFITSWKLYFDMCHSRCIHINIYFLNVIVFAWKKSVKESNH